MYVQIASVVIYLINYSINVGQVPNTCLKCHNWLAAVTRCISLTLILSRITERVIVNRWLRPSIPPEFLFNQYAYRPTGSTTVALVHPFHSLTRMLEDAACVRAILIDFAEAFDIADHTVLMSNLAELQLPGNIYSWIRSFLSARQQVFHFSGTVSFSLGFVQG